MSDPFHIIGVAFTVLAAAAIVIAAAVFVYALLIDGRFGLIFFRRSERRLSIASWWNAKLMSADFQADDWPIGDRPFYLSYRWGKRRLFIMLGTIPDAPRSGAISGKHPDEHKWETEA